MKYEHEQVLATMRNAGLLTTQAIKSIRGQLMGMNDAERELYLRKIIKGTVRR